MVFFEQNSNWHKENYGSQTRSQQNATAIWKHTHTNTPAWNACILRKKITEATEVPIPVNDKPCTFSLQLRMHLII